MGRKSEKYETIYGDKTEDELLDEVRGNVTSGTCPNCGGDNTLVCEGAFFHCTQCDFIIGAEDYYRMLVGLTDWEMSEG